MIQNPALPPVVSSGHQLDRPTCLALLASGRLGRLVFTHRALPDVLPAHYRLDREKILIRLAIGAMAMRASRNTVVAFTVDEFDLTAQAGWSVTAVGYAHEIIEPDARMAAALTGLRSWQEAGQTSLLSITTEKITGCRLAATF